MTPISEDHTEQKKTLKCGFEFIFVLEMSLLIALARIYKSIALICINKFPFKLFEVLKLPSFL